MPILARELLTNTLVMTAVTDSNGRYRFSSVTAATYRLGFAGPAMLVPTQCDQGSDDETDSDGCQQGLTTVGQSASFTVGPNQQVSGWDAGFTQPVLVNGQTYLDQNQNGQHDAGEPPISGVLLILQCTALAHWGHLGATAGQGAPQGGNEIARLVTGADGSYAFTQLVPGHYQLLIEPPSGFAVAGSTLLMLPLYTPGTTVNELAGLVTVPPTNLTNTPEPTHQLYLPFIQAD